GYGYYMSGGLFESMMGNPVMLPVNMLIILFLTIVGTYITFKFSITFILNLIRRRKNGHVNVNDVLSITSVMFKMRSNAFLLTVITVITAISITAMSLSYISYYSTEKMLESTEPYDYTVENKEDLDYYETLLKDHGYDIEKYEKTFMSSHVEMDMESPLPEQEISYPIVSDEEFEGYDLKNNEVYVTGTLAILDFFTNMEEGTAVTFVNDDSYEKTLEITKVYTEGILPSRLTFGMPV